MSRHERTGWRDNALSARHRAWGHGLPAVDIDLMLVEYGSHARPACIVEYKACRPETVDLSGPSLRALATVGDRARLPVLLVCYAPGAWVFRVTGLNHLGREIAPDGVLTESEFVQFLYRLRGRPVPGRLAARLAAAESVAGGQS